jgi:galactose mutarotase-like enzyme
MIIESKYLKAEFSSKGAELISLQDQSGAQYIWQGKEGFWPGKAPLMFPICGFLKENYYYYKNDQYFMQVHGFAANSQFEVLKHELNCLSFSLKSSIKSKMHYPFEFEFIIEYTLIENTLRVKMSVINQNEQRMLFSYGWHPGFNLNWIPNDCIDNYYLAFPNSQDLQRRPVNTDGLLEGNLQALKINENKTLSLDKSSFNERAIVLEDYPHEKVSLRHIHSAKSIDMTFENFPHLTLWGQPGADFICLEPWHGLGDFSNHNQRFIHKKGLIKLPAGSRSEASIELTVNLP